MKKLYQERECLECGQLIREGAYSGKDGNFRKHVKAHLSAERNSAPKAQLTQGEFDAKHKGVTDGN